MAKPDVSHLRTLLDSARHISLLLPRKPDFDGVAAALGLKLSLETAGKTIRVVCPDTMLVEFNRLVGIDTVSTTLGNHNLVISFPGQTELVDKVSYNLDQGELQLVITPKNPSQTIDHTRMRVAPASGKTDLIILFGIDHPQSLGHLYEDSQYHFANTTVVSLYTQTPQTSLTINEIYDLEASSLSELVTHIIDSLDLAYTEDSASNLLLGLEKATSNFQHHKVSASTFEAALILMRKGAKRHHTISAADFPTGSIPVSAPVPSSVVGYGTDSSDTTEVPLTPPQTQANSKKPPADWYEPKIYKGPMLP